MQGKAQHLLMYYCCPYCLLYLQISVMVAKDAEMHKSKLNYFMKQFYGIIRKVDSTNKELSIAIRGYGLFAAVCHLLVYMVTFWKC